MGEQFTLAPEKTQFYGLRGKRLERLHNPWRGGVQHVLIINHSLDSGMGDGTNEADKLCYKLCIIGWLCQLVFIPGWHCYPLAHV